MRNLKGRMVAAVTSLNMLVLAALAWAQTPVDPVPGDVGATTDGSIWGWVIGAVVLLVIIYALTRRRGAPRP